MTLAIKGSALPLLYMPSPGVTRNLRRKGSDFVSSQVLIIYMIVSTDSKTEWARMEVAEH